MAATRVSLVLSALAVLRCAVARVGGLTVLTEANFDSFIKDNPRVLVDFTNAESRDEAPLSEALAEMKARGHSVNVGMVNADQYPNIARKYVPNGGLPQLLWFHHGEPTQYHMTMRSTKAIVNFLMQVDRDPLAAIDSEDDVRTLNASSVVLVRTAAGSPLFKLAEVVASKHLDTIAFAWLRGWQGEDSLEATIEGQHQPYLEDEFTIDSMDQWIRSLMTRSEDIPDFEDEDAAEMIVGRNFVERVMEPGQDALLLVFASWCGHCKRMMPTWEKVARTLKDVDHINVLKMDGSRNDSPVPEIINWRAFPTVFFLKDGSQQPAIFRGNRSVKGFVDFAKQQSSKDFDWNFDEDDYEPEEL